jgi:glycosyltransferase involved in cell wall biosynthesis
MVVTCYGFRGVGSQIDRIEEGFRALGHEVTSDVGLADLVYCNDSGSFGQVIDAKARGTIRGKVVFNQLDLAPHLGAAFPLALIREQLTHADAVTTISQTVARDIKARLGIDATVIYNPIRAVTRARGVRLYKGLFVGRVQDHEKRAVIGAAALSILGYGWDDMVTVGRELPPYGGQYYGEATDAELSGFYNTCDYLICPTRNAFLGPPILEAMACGCIPVVCRDLDILDEFLPATLFPEYREVEPTAPSIARFIARYQGDISRAEMSDRLYNHYARTWAGALSPAGVASAIERVYRSL